MVGGVGWCGQSKKSLVARAGTTGIVEKANFTSIRHGTPAAPPAFGTACLEGQGLAWSPRSASYFRCNTTVCQECSGIKENSPVPMLFNNMACRIKLHPRILSPCFTPGEHIPSAVSVHLRRRGEAPSILFATELSCFVTRAPGHAC